MRGVLQAFGRELRRVSQEAARCATLLALALAAAHPATAATLSGNPPLSRFAPDISVFPQNFDIAQDAESVVYVANADGVLTFDGERWQLLRLPNADLARTLASDGHGRVYVGGYDVFGYIERDAQGVETFRDLTPLFRSALRGESFGDIWGVHVAPQGVFFKAVTHVFLYRPDSELVQLWRHPGRFGAIVQHRGDVLLQFRGEGLKRLRDGGWELVAGGAQLKEHVFELIPLPGDGLLTLARDGSWNEYRDGTVRPHPMPPGFPDSSFCSGGRRLGDGTLALGCDDGAIYFYDPVARAGRRFRIDADSLSGLVMARDGGLLAVDDLAVFHVTWPSAWTVLGAATGLTGSTHGLARWGERWLVLSSAGVYEPAADAGELRFVRRDWTDHEAWDLLALDDGSALLAESYVLKLIQPDGRTRTLTRSNFYPRLLLASRADPGRVYVGTESGLAILQRAGRDWRLLLDADDASSLLINSLVEMSPTELWVGTDRDGVQRLRLSADGIRVESTQAFGAEQGITYGRVAGAKVVRDPDGSLLASTASGLYRLDRDRFQRTELDGLDALRVADEWLSLAWAPNGDTWAFSHSQIYHRAGEGAWQREEIASFLRGAVEAAAFEPAGAALFGASSSLLRFDPAHATAPGTAPRLALRTIERIDAEGRREPLQRDAGQRPELVEEETGITFRFALPEFRRADVVRYQGRLVGVEERFQNWSQATSYSYQQLAPGSYRFEARARDAQGQVTEIEPFSFEVRPRWYNTLWARALGVLLLVAVLAALSVVAIRARTRRLAKETQRLEQLVAERTRELQSANRQLEAMAHLDGLTEVPNRRRLDDYLAEVWVQCANQKRPLSVIAIDVDHFKAFNDRCGHLAGDEMLRRLVRVLSHCLRRAEDLVARFGGDEFIVVLPGGDPGIAQELAESMRQRVEEAQLGPTVSIGMATCWPRVGDPVSLLVQQADAALYRAKDAGRNRVVIAPPLVAG